MADQRYSVQTPICQCREVGAIRRRNTELCVWTRWHFLFNWSGSWHHPHVSIPGEASWRQGLRMKWQERDARLVSLGKKASSDGYH